LRQTHSLADHLNGALLPDHGLRLVVPGDKRGGRSSVTSVRIDIEVPECSLPRELNARISGRRGMAQMCHPSPAARAIRNQPGPDGDAPVARAMRSPPAPDARPVMAAATTAHRAKAIPDARRIAIRPKQQRLQ